VTGFNGKWEADSWQLAGRQRRDGEAAPLEEGALPLPGFSVTAHSKGFKSRVLKLCIIRELRALFAELRIVKGIARGKVGRFESWKVCRLRKEGEGRA